MSQPPIASSTHRYRLRRQVGSGVRNWPLPSGRSRVGRDIDNELVLDEDGVSRHHATLWLEAGRLVVTDAKSKNGTFLNGQSIVRAEITVGDVLAFGSVELTCEAATLAETVLAVDLHGSGTTMGYSRLTNTATARAIASDRGSWLDLGRSFSSALRKSGVESEALATLTAGLGLRGAALLRRATNLPAALVATHGSIDTQEIEGAAAQWAATGRSLVIEAEVCGYAPPDVSYPWCIVLAGEFPGRPKCSPLLALLLESYASWRTQSKPAAQAVETTNSRSPQPELTFPSGFLPGSSPAMQDIFDQIKALAIGQEPVLIIGETGVGKEPIARTLHLSSPRHDQPLVAVNCAAVPSDLLEAEFFGIGERVATGVTGRQGLFRRAAGGTILLDEVGTMALQLQAKLLRVLQEREFFPIGASKPIPIDARVVAATNAELQTEIQLGRFRSDLFYRLAGYELRIPPLRERREDIPALVEHFLRRSCDEIERPIHGLTAGAMERLVAHPWPGNIRQLQHEIRALVYRCPVGGVIDQEMLRKPASEDVAVDAPTPSIMVPSYSVPTAASAAPPDLKSGFNSSLMPTADAMPSTDEHSGDIDSSLELGGLEKAAVQEALRRSQGNQRQAAALLGITRSSFRRRLKRYEIS